MNSYAKKLAAAAELVGKIADEIKSLENQRAEWEKPEYKTFDFGSKRFYLVRKDGSVTPELEEFQKAALKAIDDRISEAYSRLEGARFKIVQLGKETRYG